MWIWKRRKWWNSKKFLAVFLYSWRHWSTVSPQRRLKGWSLILLDQGLETVFLTKYENISVGQSVPWWEWHVCVRSHLFSGRSFGRHERVVLLRDLPKPLRHRGQVDEKNQKNPIRDAEMKERTAEWKPQRVQICVVTSRHLGTLMRTYQTSLACAVSLKDDSTEGENSFWYSVWHFSWYRSTQKSKRTFSPFCPWKTNT